MADPSRPSIHVIPGMRYRDAPAVIDGGRGYSCRDLEGHVWSFGDYDPLA